MKNLEQVKKHFNFKLTDNWSNECDFYIYEESTADGYSVYIATDNIDNLCVSENVYYYDSDLKDALIDYIKYIDKEVGTIYIDDLHATFIDEAIQELNELMEEQIQEAKND